MQFYFSEDTVDDLMNVVLKELLSRPFNIDTTRGKESGPSSEIIGSVLKLSNPLARLSRTETKGTVFSALGEILWYLSKKNDLDFIKYYIARYTKESEDGTSIYGAYGPRLFNSSNKYDQISNVIALLKKRPNTRKAAMQIFEARDLEVRQGLGEHNEIPCTCTLQFLIRDNLLHMITYMRSNDAFWGLPHDIFAFTMLQEIIARSVGVDLGTYTHSVGSLHLYKKMKDEAVNYLDEGFQSTKKLMAAMPDGDPWSAIEKLLEIEQRCRLNEIINFDDLAIDPYWKDLAVILQIYSLIKQGKLVEVKNFQPLLSNEAYQMFVEKRLNFAINKKRDD